MVVGWSVMVLVVRDWSSVVSDWSNDLSYNWGWMVDLRLWLMSIMDWSSNNLVDWGSDDVLLSSWFTTDDSVETVVLIGGVFDDTVVTVSIVQAVGSLDVVAIAGFMLLLDVTGLFIMNGVREVVLGWCLVFGVLVHGSGNSLYQSWGSMLVVHWSSFMVRWVVVV